MLVHVTMTVYSGPVYPITPHVAMVIGWCCFGASAAQKSLPDIILLLSLENHIHV